MFATVTNCDLTHSIGGLGPKTDLEIKNCDIKLPKEEAETILMCKNFTSSWGGTRKLPYAFTEQGVYMQKGIE